MKDNGIVNIHGKEYVTVARRLEMAHEETALEGVVTEVISHDPVVVKATLTLKGKTYTGISAVDLETHKQIEKANPYEVAETSAVGRALGFAGYGAIESVASADEVIRATKVQTANATAKPKTPNIDDFNAVNPKDVEDALSAGNGVKLTCETCGAPATHKEGTSAKGKDWEAIFCSTGERDHAKWL